MRRSLHIIQCLSCLFRYNCVSVTFWSFSCLRTANDVCCLTFTFVICLQFVFIAHECGRVVIFCRIDSRVAKQNDSLPLFYI